MLWRESTIESLALGTAQLGMPYGVANTKGQPSPELAAALVGTAWSAGIRLFDTAQAYGTSEAVLGTALEAVNKNGQAKVETHAKVITKFLPERLTSVPAAIEAARESLAKLRQRKLFAIFAHSAASLESPSLVQCLAALKSEGLCEFTGVSVYTPQDAARALEIEHIDIIQMPLNALDRGAIEYGVMEKAQQADKLLMFRSALLQGLLTLEPGALAPKMSFAEETVSQWRAICRSLELDPSTAAIQVALTLAAGYPLVIGVETEQQLRANIESSARRIWQVDELIERTRPLAAACSERIKNPALW